MYTSNKKQIYEKKSRKLADNREKCHKKDVNRIERRKREIIFA